MASTSLCGRGITWQDFTSPTTLAASKSAQTPVGVVKSAGRKKEDKWLTTLGDMNFEPVDMTSLVIVGNKTTYVQDGLMVTPRGYTL